MATLTQEILEDLICEVCECVLSCAPVYLNTDSSSVCGRCTKPKKAARNKPYERLATLVSFPCRYQQHGCQHSAAFDTLTPHEGACEFHPFICPVASPRSCDWVGPKHQLLQHCEAKHPQQVLQNTCKLKHDITANSLNTYLMSVFQALFLLHTKVCVATRNIFHSVQLLGDCKNVSQYIYEVEIKNGDMVLKKKGVVAPQGVLALQEDRALAIDINGLLEVLGRFDDTTFKITLSEKCTKCQEVMDINYRSECCGQCAACAPRMVTCVYSGQGCVYTDIPYKADRHQMYHCRYSTECMICLNSISVAVDLEEHYRREHSDVTHGAGVTWTVATPGYGVERSHIVTCDVGALVCWYKLYSSQFTFYVCSPLQSGELCGYTCELWLSDPVTGTTVHRTLDVEYEWWDDWFTDIPRDTINQVLANEQFDMKLELKKMPTP